MTDKEKLDDLKLQANELGIKYSPNIGLEALEKKISDELINMDSMSSNTKETTDTDIDIDTDDTENSKKKAERLADLVEEVLSPNPTKRRAQLLAKASKLIRCKVICNDPDRSHWNGDIITASNEYIPVMKKYIPFNTVWTVPQLLINAMQAQKFTKTIKVNHANNNRPVERRIVYMPKYTIEILPPITTDEFNAIKQKQLASKINDEG